MGQYEELIAHDARFSLHDALDSARCDYREDFRKYWGLSASEPPKGMDSDEWLELRRLFWLAQQVAAVASTLIRHKGIGRGRLSQGTELAEGARALEEKVHKALQIIRERHGSETWVEAYQSLLPQIPTDPRTRHAVFRNSLEIECADLFIPDLAAVAVRLQALTKHLVASQNERTNAYLSLVARSYCLDQRTELAILCRAALDTALQDIAPDEIIRAKRGTRANERIGLEKRIDYLQSEDRITSSQATVMMRIKKAGDDAAHLLPGVEPEADSLLSDLVSSLSATNGSGEQSDDVPRC